METNKKVRTNTSKRSNNRTQKDTIRFFHINGSNPTAEWHLRAKQQSSINLYHITGPSLFYQHETSTPIVMSVLVNLTTQAVKQIKHSIARTAPNKQVKCHSRGNMKYYAIIYHGLITASNTAPHSCLHAPQWWEGEKNGKGENEKPHRLR